MIQIKNQNSSGFNFSAPFPVGMDSQSKIWYWYLGLIDVIIGRHICELNNKTKEARPEDFVQDFKRFYMRHSFNSGIKVFSKISRILHDIPYSINSLVKQFATLDIT